MKPPTKADLTREAAEAHARALIALTSVKP